MNLEQWEAHYRRGTLATCPTVRDGGVDLEARASWVEFFSMLPDHARILDVGTGNGVVALIAAETAAERGLNWDIHGADLARINPQRHVADGARRLAGIRFHAGVATERLPFEAGSFDAVSGNFALEYTDVARALAEIHRVLKPGGNVQFVLHHPDSMFVRGALTSSAEADLVFTETKAYRRLHRLVTMDQATPGTTQRADEDLRAAIQTLKKGLEDARKHGAGWILSAALDGIKKLLEARRQMKPQDVGLEVDRAEAELRASVRGLNDLIEHARTPQQMDEIERAATTAGFSLIERSLQHYAGTNLVGWQLQLHRN